MKQEAQSQQERKPLPWDNLPEPLKDFEASLTGFEQLENAMDKWLSTDTGDDLERKLDELAREAANEINSLLEEGGKRI